MIDLVDKVVAVWQITLKVGSVLSGGGLVKSSRDDISEKLGVPDQR